MEQQDWKKAELAEWLYIDMVFYFPDKRIRDSHNCLKILMDAIEGIVFQNDYYVLPRIQGVELDRGNPRVELSITYQTQKERQKHLLKLK